MEVAVPASHPDTVLCAERTWLDMREWVLIGNTGAVLYQLIYQANIELVHCRGHGFESRSGLIFFQAKFNLKTASVGCITAMSNHVLIFHVCRSCNRSKTLVNLFSIFYSTRLLFWGLQTYRFSKSSSFKMAASSKAIMHGYTMLPLVRAQCR